MPAGDSQACTLEPGAYLGSTAGLGVLTAIQVPQHANFRRQGGHGIRDGLEGLLTWHIYSFNVL